QRARKASSAEPPRRCGVICAKRATASGASLINFNSGDSYLRRSTLWGEEYADEIDCCCCNRFFTRDRGRYGFRTESAAGRGSGRGRRRNGQQEGDLKGLLRPGQRQGSARQGAQEVQIRVQAQRRQDGIIGEGPRLTSG